MSAERPRVGLLRAIAVALLGAAALVSFAYGVGSLSRFIAG